MAWTYSAEHEQLNRCIDAAMEDTMGQRRTYKHRCCIDGNIYSFDMDADARIVYVGHQEHSFVTFWSEGTSGAKRTRSFRIYGTGWPINDGDTYVGTAIIGDFVWHLYEVGADRH